MHAGGRRFDPAWLHQVVPGIKVAIKLRIFEILSISSTGRTASRGQNLWVSFEMPFFNNIGVLSRAFWVQNDFECVCDEHMINLNGHKTVSAKNKRI